jgi:hypothetical protein
MDVKPGARLRSVVDTTEVIVVRAPSEPLDLRCGGRPLVELGDESGGDGSGPVAPFDTGTLLGKRYVHADSGLELLCTKAGAGALSVGDELLPVKEAKPLPSSD